MFFDDAFELTFVKVQDLLKSACDGQLSSSSLSAVGGARHTHTITKTLASLVARRRPAASLPLTLARLLACLHQRDQCVLLPRFVPTLPSLRDLGLLVCSLQARSGYARGSWQGLYRCCPNFIMKNFSNGLVPVGNELSSPTFQYVVQKFNQKP